MFAVWTTLGQSSDGCGEEPARAGDGADSSGAVMCLVWGDLVVVVVVVMVMVMTTVAMTLMMMLMIMMTTTMMMCDHDGVPVHASPAHPALTCG